MFLTLINGIQPVTSNLFNSIGKSQLGVFMVPDKTDSLFITADHDLSIVYGN
jgi:hypothetical protein